MFNYLMNLAVLLFCLNIVNLLLIDELNIFLGSYCNHYFLQMIAHIGRGHYHAAYDAGQFFINNTVITIFYNSDFIITVSTIILTVIFSSTLH